LSFDNFGFSGSGFDIFLWRVEQLGFVGIEWRGWIDDTVEEGFGGESDSWIGVDGTQDSFGFWSGHDGNYAISGFDGW
jgi:hypothetical protein